MTDIELHGVTVSYGSTAVLHDVDLVVASGELTVLVGESGSGKTTLLRTVAGFERPSAGEIRIGGRLVNGPRTWVRAQQRRLGWVAQDGALFPHLDVAANVAFGRPRSSRRDRDLADLLEMVGLGGLAGRYPNQLSGGQQQRVALARALAIRPAAVLLDEPFSSLDPGLRAQVRADVLGILARSGTTVLLVTHDRDEGLSVGTRIAVLRHGTILAFDSPQTLYRTPPDPLTAAYLGDANLLPGRVTSSGGAVETALGSLPLDGPTPIAAGQEVVVLVRPEQMRLAADGAGLAATVTARSYQGHETVVHARADGLPDLIIRVGGDDTLPVGGDVVARAQGPVIAWPVEPAPAQAT